MQLLYREQWRIQDFEKGGSVPIPRSRRQCIEVRSDDPYAPSAEKKNSPPFFTYLYHAGLSWHLHALYCKFQM